MIPLSLRQALLDDLRPDHQSVDDLFSGLDLTNIDGLRAFLAAQFSGLCAMHRAAALSPTCRVTTDLNELCGRIARDLDWLNAPVSPPPQCAPPTMHPLAIEYIFLGSRLGGRVLKRRWQAAIDPRVLGAQQMFTAPDPALNWRDFCAELSEIRAASGLGRQVIADARTGFHLFQAANQPAATAQTNVFSEQRGRS